MNRTRIITCCTRGFPGSDNSLLTLEKTTGLTRHLTLVSSDAGSPEISFFIDHIKREKPEVLIFGGWTDIYNVFLKKLQKENIRFGVYWTSSPGQSDISQEIEKLSFVLNNPLIKYRFFSGKDFAAILKKQTHNAYYLPITLSLARKDPRDNAGKTSKDIVISLFCSTGEYKRKNILNTLLALAGLKRDFRLYLSGLSKDRYYSNILELLSIPYKDFGWMGDREKYDSVFDEIDIGLQVSFAETYNHVAAEHFIRAIPVIISAMVPAAACMPEAVRDKLVVNSADSALAIREKIKYLIDKPRARRALGVKASESLEKYNAQSINIASRCLRGVIRDKG